jgi:hypothetical protein
LDLPVTTVDDHETGGASALGSGPPDDSNI